MPITDSILSTVKSHMGIQPTFTGFDNAIIPIVNSMFGSVRRLGVGPTSFSIDSEEKTWKDYLGENDDLYVNAHMYICMSTRLAFDPPQNSFLVTALQEKIKEYEWELEVLSTLNKEETT